MGIGEVVSSHLRGWKANVSYCSKAKSIKEPVILFTLRNFVVLDLKGASLIKRAIAHGPRHLK